MRVLVLFEPGRGGLAALSEARALADHEHAALTVVGVAPQAPSGSRCGNSAVVYNEAVADSVVADLEEARRRLGNVAASYRLLIEGSAPSLAELALDGHFDLVLLPGRRRPFRAAGHPAAARLSGCADAEVRVVDARRSVVAG
jgi:nucleotide-binding universal stress UspA family protein